MVIEARLYTADEFWTEFGDQKGLELIRGVPTAMAPTGEAHGVVSLWLGYLLMSFVESHDLGELTGAETGFILSRDPYTVRAPDVGFISKTRLTKSTSPKYFEGAPDLAVEVVSPGDGADTVHERVLDFLNAGTRLIWVIYPATRTVLAYGSDSSTSLLDQDGTLTGGDVLPGLSLPVRDIFKKLRD